MYETRNEQSLQCKNIVWQSKKSPSTLTQRRNGFDTNV